MESSNPWKGLLLGAAGGLAGTLAMGYYFKAAVAAEERIRGGEGGDEEEGGPAADAASISVVGRRYEEGEDSTEAAGRLAYQALFGHPPRAKETRKVMGEAAHWAFGMSMGALYGAVRGRAAMPDVAGGAGFGTTVWLAGSNLAVPLLGLAPAPTELPAKYHAHHLASHIVYGLVTAATTQALRRLFR